VVAVTQIDTEGKAHLDFHCNEYGTLLKSIPLMESWDVVSRVHRIQSKTKEGQNPVLIISTVVA